MKKSFLALGRLKKGTLNKTEAAYQLVLESKKQSGEILWYRFEGMKFMLAERTSYTPDFNVMLANGEMQMHEVKGARAIFMDDSRVKIKVAAQMYPFKFVAIFPKKGGWEVEEF